MTNLFKIYRRCDLPTFHELTFTFIVLIASLSELKPSVTVLEGTKGKSDGKKRWEGKREEHEVLIGE